MRRIKGFVHVTESQLPRSSLRLIVCCWWTLALVLVKLITMPLCLAVDAVVKHQPALSFVWFEKVILTASGAVCLCLDLWRVLFVLICGRGVHFTSHDYSLTDLKNSDSYFCHSLFIPTGRFINLFSFKVQRDFDDADDPQGLALIKIL